MTIGPERTGSFSGEISVEVKAADGVSSSHREAISLRVLPESFILVDLPERRIFGLPVSLGVSPAGSGGGRFAFALGGGEGALRFEGRYTPRGQGIEGTVRQGGLSGRFALSRQATAAERGHPLEVMVHGGALRGTLMMPAGAAAAGAAAAGAAAAGAAAAGAAAAGAAAAGAAAAAGRGGFHLAIFVPGSGSTDRDGNNYQVPGMNDSTLQLALALASRGIASFRYDKRGVGESWALAPEESRLRFDDYIEDLRAVLARLAKEPGFSGISLVGHSEGSLVAAATLAAAVSLPVLPWERQPDLVVLATGSTSARDTFAKAIETSPVELVDEGRAILDAMLSGRTWPVPSEYFAEVFRPSFQPYLSSWLRYDLRTELPGIRGRILLVEGDRDMQVDIGNFLGLAAARADAAAVVVRGMNHVLKEVPAEVDLNYAAFSDPSFALSSDLVETLVSFMGGKPLPGSLVRVDGGRVP
ncbi:MAG: alpha/beta hydrolase [Rectinemataceae bacterium]